MPVEFLKAMFVRAWLFCLLEFAILITGTKTLKPTNKLVLFTGAFRSWTGFVIAVVTGCEFVHAAVQVGQTGEWWHSSERLGRFDRLQLDDYANRYCVVIEFEGDLSKWLNRMQGTCYDWKGVLGWVLQANNAQKFYCFEAALEALKACNLGLNLESPVSGCDLLTAVRKVPKRYGRFLDFNLVPVTML